MEQVCVDCGKSRVDSQCGICAGVVCRKCRVFLAEEEFPLETQRPPELTHTFYCGGCSAQVIEPFRQSYEQTVAAARDVNVFFKESKSTFRLKRKAQEPLRIEGSADRDHAILSLAFQAARAGYNSLVDVQVESKKQRNHGYQKSSWSSSGTPAEIRSYELDRQ